MADISSSTKEALNTCACSQDEKDIPYQYIAIKRDRQNRDQNKNRSLHGCLIVYPIGRHLAVIPGKVKAMTGHRNCTKSRAHGSYKWKHRSLVLLQHKIRNARMAYFIESAITD